MTDDRDPGWAPLDPMLDAGQTLTFRERWESAPKGTYTVVAELSSTNHPVETRAEISVP